MDYNTTMQKKPTPKFRSAEEKRRWLEAQASWEEIQARHRPAKPVALKQEALTFQFSVPPGRETPRLPSITDTHRGAVASARPPAYTGSAVLGISTLHKSNAVPVFSAEEAVNIAKMRRG